MKLKLFWKCTPQGITNIVFDHGSYFICRIKCTTCQEEYDNIWFSILEEKELIHGHGTAHLQMKCKECLSEMYIKILEHTDYACDGSQYTHIATFECRKVELLQWHPSASFHCISENTGQKFSNIDLSEDEWYDVDDQNEPVMISDIMYYFKKS